MINVGLVGFGLSGRFLQAPFYLVNPNFNLAKVVTSQELPKNLFATTEKVSSIDDLLEDDSIQLISICSPNSTHYDYAKRALEKGKHVMVEKPLTAKVEQAEELYLLAEKKKLVLCVYQNRRFDSDFLTVKKIIKSGVLGEILSYEAHFDRFKPLLNKKAWKEVQSDGNGILYDLGAHLVDQSITLFGAPQNVYGETFKQREGSTVDDAFNLNLTFGNIKVNLKSSLMVKDQGPKYIIHGTLGSFTKYGMDLQEDHLSNGILPIQPGFGVEPKDFSGNLMTNLAGLEFEGTVGTEVGSWNNLFDNLAYSILKGREFLEIKPEQILTQINILESLSAKEK